MKFNEKLLDLRKQKGWSQEELGDKLNVSRQTISKWEMGQTTPELENLIILSKIFDISIDDLVENPRNQINIEVDNAQDNDVKADNLKTDDTKSTQKAENKNIRKKKRRIFYIIIVFLLVGICAGIYYRGYTLMQTNRRIYNVTFDVMYNHGGCLDIQTYETLNGVVAEKRTKIFKYNEVQKFEDGSSSSMSKGYKIQEFTYGKLVKERYFNTEEQESVYDNVIEINYEDNTYKILNNYEFDNYFTSIIHTEFDSMFNVESLGGMYEAIKLENQILEDDRFYYVSNEKINSILQKDYVTLKIDKENSWLKLVSKEYDDNKKANTKETICIITNIIDEKDIEIPDLSQFTYAQN